ncbi:MAG: NAD(P)-binding domain-containing protein, partial [Acidimicrobiia bacterium]
MQLGVVGLGRMGYGLVSRLRRAGHDCVVFDRDAKARERAVGTGARAAANLEELAAMLDGPRHVWVMVPAGITGAVIDDLASALSEGDTIIDGGNSNYRDDQVRAVQLAARGLTLLDVGTSGGVFGDERGFCLMIGGDTAAVDRLTPIWETLAPGVDSA